MNGHKIVFYLTYSVNYKSFLSLFNFGNKNKFLKDLPSDLYILMHSFKIYHIQEHFLKSFMYENYTLSKDLYVESFRSYHSI